MLVVSFLVVLGIALLAASMGLNAVVSAVEKAKRIEKISMAGAFPFVGDITSGSPIIASVADTSGVAVGMKVAGNGFTSVGTVLSKTANSVTLSINAGTTVADQTYFGYDDTLVGTDGADVRLYKSSLSPNVNTTLAEFEAEEADFAGYAAVPLDLTLGYVDGAGNPIAQSQLLRWQPTDAVTPNTIGGLWIDGGTDPIMFWPLASPVALVSAASELAVVVTDAYLPPGNLTQVTPPPAP